MTASIYSMVTDRIINNLNQGVIPWRKPWKTPIHKNLVTGKPYRGVNAVMTFTSFYSNPNWITFLQAKELGLSIKKGEKATPIIFYKELDGVKTMKDQETGEEMISLSNCKFVLNYYNIFNLQQTDYINESEEVFEPIIHCEDVVRNMKNKPEIIEGKSIAGYIRKDDKIFIPYRSSFTSSNEFYSTLYHELVHSTGHWSRLNRDELNQWKAKGDEHYSKEELVAEIGSSFLCSYTGIDNSLIENQTAYINGWLSELKNDKALILRASAKAQSAVDYILQSNPIES